MATVYRPKHQRQLVSTDPYGGKNCAAYSAAMAIDRATLGGVAVTGRQVRSASNEPIPDPASPGLNIPQLVNVAFGWHIALNDRTGAPWASVMAALREYRGVILFGDYDVFPAGVSCQAGFKGDHSVYVNHITGDGDLFVMDPLCPAGKEVKEATMRAYAEKMGKATGHGLGVLFAVTRITPLIG